MKVNSLSERPSMPANASDVELLRRFEPVLRFTRGEQFFPISVERYVRECSLWEHYPNGTERLLVTQGSLDIDGLVESRPAVFGTVRFLRFIETLSLTEAAQALGTQVQLRRARRDNFRAGTSRLVRSGFLPRIADALFSLSFLMRGRVSSATAAAAEIAYERMQMQDGQNTYYGRIIRQNGWTVLQYWYFYCYNSWRSEFHGVNDHESDWEMVNIYLYENGDQLMPEWVAYASHDFHGDDLRRRWDDLGELDFVDGHPVVFTGAGSHASYFRSGEYQAEVTLPLPGWVSKTLKLWNKLWNELLDQPPGNPFRIPFVDYARGDGRNIGFDQPHSWSLQIIDESTPWVSQYRGLWGLFARDPISGENAPAGPMYNRDGTPRGAWFDPLGFAGLDKVPPPPQAIELLEKNLDSITRQQVSLQHSIDFKSAKLQSEGITLKGMEGNPHLAKQYAALEKEIEKLSEELKDSRREYSENIALMQSLADRLEMLQADQRDNPRAHIRHLATPVQVGKMRFGRVAETWAALSLSLMLIAVAFLAYFYSTSDALVGIFIIGVMFMLLDAFLRGAFIQTLSRLTAALAIVSGLVLIYHFWLEILVGGLMAMAIYLLFERWRELSG